MIPDRNIYDIIAEGREAAFPEANEQRALKVWALELVRERWGLYSAPEQMVNAAWLIYQQVTGATLPTTGAGATKALDRTMLPFPAAGLPSASYPPPAATP